MSTNITILGGEIEQAEADAYVERCHDLYGRYPIGLTIKLDGEYADLDYDFGTVPFQRIRRITGYLVGTLDRFNNAKRAEETERIKHSIA